MDKHNAAPVAPKRSVALNLAGAVLFVTIIWAVAKIAGSLTELF